jgi:rare lipoprotein A
MLVVSGCGGHKKVKAKLPPPPSAPSQPASEVSLPQSAKPIYVETGLASWYGPPYHNRRGSNGEIYDQNKLTAAHRTLPLNSWARVTNTDTGRSAVVRITDRGPFIQGRMLDLSLAAAKAVDVWRPGVAEVRLELLQAPAAIDRGGRWCVQIGAFDKAKEAAKLKEKLQRRYETAKVLQFTGPTGEWVRVRVQDDDKRRAEQVAHETHASQGAVFLVRLD